MNTANESLTIREINAKLVALGINVVSRNKPYLLRKLATAEEAKAAEERKAAEARKTTTKSVKKPGKKDTRLPVNGTVLVRESEGKKHEVTVNGAKSFTYEGREYSSLSTIAREITGTPWNGYLFFKLIPYAKREPNKH
jgi:hypothetical protein